jgi:hypothetical protein
MRGAPNASTIIMVHLTESGLLANRGVPLLLLAVLRQGLPEAGAWTLVNPAEAGALAKKRMDIRAQFYANGPAASRHRRV